MMMAIQERHPATGQSVLMNLVLAQKFVAVEWMLKKFGRAAFAFQNQSALNIMERWEEEQKAAEERAAEKQRLEEMRARGEDVPPLEDEEPEADTAQLIMESVGGEVELSDVKRIGQLGVYEGARTTNGVKEGHAQALFANGDLYIGEYKNNTRHGLGAYFWAKQGHIYIGHWVNNIREGEGRMIYSDGTRYIGNFHEDKRSGYGRLTYPNGDVYSGEFVQNVKEGLGTLVNAADRATFEGYFRDGEFVGGRWIQPNGTVYHGVFKNGAPCGRGVYLFSAVGGGGDGRKKRLGTGVRQQGSWRGTKWIPAHTDNVSLEAAPPIAFSLNASSPNTTISYPPAAEVITSAAGRAKASSKAIADLVTVINFPPFVQWAEELDQDICVESIVVDSVEYDPDTPSRLVAVTMKITATRQSTGLTLPMAPVTLQAPVAALVVMFTVEEQSFLVLCDGRFLTFADSPGSPSFKSTAVKELDGFLGPNVNLSKAQCHTVNLGGQAGLRCIYLYRQLVWKEWVASIQSEAQAKPGMKITFVPLQSVQTQLDSDPFGVAVLQALAAAELPDETAPPQRPKTPPPPPKEPLPIYSAAELSLQEKARRDLEIRRKAKEGEGEDEEEDEDEEPGY
eukprot:NODE_471_length_2059_cov_102.989552_g372_i0.p1 GENE.NODE_471_length_2059_cov_102.989552_g372_i0~~NODE_471_length_2059_cov_102.989552_g372_i0.p1  ORF type:complete len:666 (+),score=198.50 NODE_471_length_2059_cov_102.989552_g372_i0:134-1999(+)